MDRFLFLMLACIVAGFALISVPLAGSFLAGIEPITTVIGILAVLVFSFILIYRGLLFLFGRSK